MQSKKQARLGEGFFTFFFNKEIIYSIRLVPGSSPGQPIIISKSCVYKSVLSFCNLLYSFINKL